MTTSLAASGQADETWPVRPEDPFATTDRLPEGTDSDQVSRFGDKHWNYTVLGRRRSEASQTVNWEAFPETLRESFRRAGWALVNLPTPAALLNRAATARVEWPAPGTMAQVFLGWRRFAVWLTDHNVTYLHQVDHDLLADYAAYVGHRGRSVAIAQDDLNAVTLLWGFAPHLLATDRIPMPPWENEGVKHYLTTDTTPNENTTPAIHPAVMSPLLIWSLRFLDFADDITAAWREHQRILARVREHPNPDATDALRGFLDTWVAEHGELPGGVARGRRGIAAQYLAGLFDTSERHVKYEATRYRENNVPVGLHAPLLLPVHGMIHGRKWKPHIHFHEAPLLMTRLATAAMIVILYLSGVRPGEGLELQVGCCPDPIDDGTGSIRYQLHGPFFKGARNPDGTPARGAQGLHIVSNFQYGRPGGSAPSDFTRGFHGGTADAQTALRLHEAAGGPDSAPIIFSIDEDINLATWNRSGVEWFRGINSVLGVERTGIYGHSRVCAWAIQDGVVGRSTSPERRWVWQTRAWSYGAREPAAVLFQGVIDTASNPGPLVGGTRVDVNDVLADDFGQWDLDRVSVSGVAPPRFDESTEIRSPYYGSRGGTAVLWFVLHTEDGRSPSARHLARYLSNNPHRVSYHYTVDNDGHVYNIVDTQNYANSVLQPGNSKSINLAFAGSWANWSRQTWFDRMRHGMDVAAYIAVLDARRNGLQPRVISPEEAGRGVTGITDHNGVRIATGRGTHTDVGAGFPWDYFIGKVDEFAAMAATAPVISLSQPYPGAPIAQGATGPQVAMIQDRLNTAADAGLLVDGEFAPLTSRAIVAFQGNRGLQADGCVGSQTWAELFSGGRILHDINGHRSAAASIETELDHYPPVGGSCSGQDGEPAELGPAPADYEPEPSISSSHLQQLRGWGVTAAVTGPAGDEMSRGGWLLPYPEPLRVVTPINPGPPVDRSRKIRNVTGPDLTDRFGMAATDLGVMTRTRTPSGRILAVFGDTFREPWVGGGDWRAPVALFSDTKNLDDGLVWSEAAGGDPNYARQLWPYPHHLDGGVTTVLPSDVMTIGESMYLHASAHFPLGTVGFSEIWKSVDDGHTWFRVGPRWDAGIHGGLAQLWTWDVGDDGWVYVLSTAFRIERDRPMILRRVPADRVADPAAYEGWGFGAGGWAWRNEPTPVLEGGFGELCLRRIQNQWVLIVFDNFGYDLDVRVFPDMTSNLYTVPTGTSIRGTAWGQEGDDAVAQLYGPSIVPGSRLDAG